MSRATAVRYTPHLPQTSRATHRTLGIGTRCDKHPVIEEVVLLGLVTAAPDRRSRPLPARFEEALDSIRAPGTAAGDLTARLGA